MADRVTKKDKPATKVKVENGPVTIEIDGSGSPKSLLAQAMAAYREVVANPPAPMRVPLAGASGGQAELAGYQPLGFHGETVKDDSSIEAPRQ